MLNRNYSTNTPNNSPRCLDSILTTGGEKKGHKGKPEQWGVTFTISCTKSFVAKWRSGFLKFESQSARNLRHVRQTPSDDRHLDEMAIIIGDKHYRPQD